MYALACGRETQNSFPFYPGGFLAGLQISIRMTYDLDIAFLEHLNSEREPKSTAS